MTLNTLVQTAWGVLLGRLTGRDDVVFGVTVAGRPPEIAGIETMVGLFINTVPLRMRLRAGQPLRALLKDVQDRDAHKRVQEFITAHEKMGTSSGSCASSDSPRPWKAAP